MIKLFLCYTILHLGEEAENYSFAQLLQKIYVSLNDFKNSFSFATEAASPAASRAIVGEAKIMPNDIVPELLLLLF
jgi:hypothetical protein